jgi:hypothetical protein
MKFDIELLRFANGIITCIQTNGARDGNNLFPEKLGNLGLGLEVASYLYVAAILNFALDPRRGTEYRNSFLYTNTNFARGRAPYQFHPKDKRTFFVSHAWQKHRECDLTKFGA